MDLETENRIAAILMKEAAELRREAEKEGVHVYLQQNKVRGRPNSRFLTATVLGVQQANRAVEVNEMWRVRQKEQELNDRLKGRSKVQSSHNSHSEIGYSTRSSSTILTADYKNATELGPSSRRECESSYSRDDEGGLRDEEVEEFLHSRLKRGRGAVGSRMDEAGPYPAPFSDSNEKLSTSSDVWQHRVLGPEKPPLLNFGESSDEDVNESRQKKRKKEHSDSSDKKHSKKHKSKEKSKHKKKKREEKRSKHHK